MPLMSFVLSARAASCIRANMTISSPWAYNCRAVFSLKPFSSRERISSSGGRDGMDECYTPNRKIVKDEFFRKLIHTAEVLRKFFLSLKARKSRNVYKAIMKRHRQTKVFLFAEQRAGTPAAVMRSNGQTILPLLVFQIKR